MSSSTISTFLIIECLDETNDATLLPTFIKKTIQIAVTSSVSTVHHLVFTKIVGLIIIYVTKISFSLSNSSIFSIQLDNISSDALIDITHEIIEKLIESTNNTDMFVVEILSM